MMAVLKCPYSLLSKQGRKVQVAQFTINRNEIFYLRSMLHISMLIGILTCSYDTSFLARILIIRDGDVESNPGPNDIDFSIKKQETRIVKGRPKKAGFKGKFTKKESSMVPGKPVNASLEINDDIQNFREIKQNSSPIVCNPVGLINYSNDCFFNSVIQALFSLQLFREHVSNFDEHSSHTTDTRTIAAASSIRNLFRAIEDMKAASDGPLMTHNYILALNLQGYVENQQFDAQECLSYIIDLFYPWDNDENDNTCGYPDDCLFLLDGEETTHCHRCGKYANKYFRETLCQVAFPEPDAESSIELVLQKIVNDSVGELMDGDERYACKHCNPIRTVATRQRTVLNAEKYIIMQLMIFGYNRNTNHRFKIVPNLIIEEEVSNILLGKLRLCAVIYHIGDSPDQGHYVCAIKEGNTWYTCNDDRVDLGVKLKCNPTIKDDLLIPYLLIYEKVHESEVPGQCVITHAMNDGESELLTFSSIEAKNVLHDIDIFDTEKKATKLDKEDNTNHFNECSEEPTNVSELMKRNLLKELEAQSKRICDIENRRKKRDELMLEIKTKNMEIATAKKSKKHLMEISKKVHCEDLSFVEKKDKLNEKMFFYDQSIKEAQSEIKLKNDALQEIDRKNITEKSRYIKMHQNKEGMNYNFGKRKSKFTSKGALCKKKLRVTNEGREKQHEIDNASKRKLRDTLDGKKRQQEVDNASKRKIRDTLDGQKKQQEVDNASKRKIRGTLDGKKKQQEVDNASKKKNRDTPEGRKKHQELMKKVRDTQDGKKKQHEVDNASKKRNRDTHEGRKKHQELMKKVRDTQDGKKKQQK